MSHTRQLHKQSYVGDDMQMMNCCLLPSNVYEGLYGQVQSQIFSTVKWTLEQALDEEVHDDLGCGRYEPSAQDLACWLRAISMA